MNISTMFNFKTRIMAMLLIIILSLSLVLSINTMAIVSDSFNDISNHAWAQPAISDLSANGIIKGYGDGTFRPDNTVTRAEFTAMAFRLYGEDTADEIMLKVEALEANYPDEYQTLAEVNSENGPEWYNNIIVASQYYYLNRWGLSSVEWNKPISRAEMAFISMKIADEVGNQRFNIKDNIKNNIGDYDTLVSKSVYKDYILKAYSNGILVGVNGNGDYAGDDNATRAQAAVIMQRILRTERRLEVVVKEQQTVPLENPQGQTGQTTTLRWDDPNRRAAREGDTFIDENGKSWKVEYDESGVLLGNSPVCLDIGRKLYDGSVVMNGVGSDGRVSKVLGEMYVVYKGHGDFASNWRTIYKNSVKPNREGTYDGEEVGYWKWDAGIKVWSFIPLALI